jgi:hypothetical protein
LLLRGAIDRKTEKLNFAPESSSYVRCLPRAPRHPR